MEKDFLYETEFCTWVTNNKNKKLVKKGAGSLNEKNIQEYVTKNKSYFNDPGDISEYEKYYYFYVPSLIASDRKDVAMKLLARVYVDIVLKDYQHSSFFKEYCRFVSKTKFNDIEKLTTEEIKHIEDD